MLVVEMRTAGLSVEEDMPNSSYPKMLRGRKWLFMVRDKFIHRSRVCSRALTVGVRRSCNGIQELHGLDIIDIYLTF